MRIYLRLIGQFKNISKTCFEIFSKYQAELLPSYAKTYILPRKMRRWSVNSEETEEEGGDRSRKGSFARKQSMVTPEFQMSMLRASLEEKKMISDPEVAREEIGEEADRVPQSRPVKSLVPCVGAGRLREYADYVKAGRERLTDL